MVKAEKTEAGSAPSRGYGGKPLPGWLKKSGTAALVFCAATAAFLVLLPMGLNQTLLSERLADRIAAWSGMKLIVKGDVSVGFFPFRATFTDVASADPLSALSLTAKRAEARFSLLSVVTGAAEVEDLLLDGTAITLRAKAADALGGLPASNPIQPMIAATRAALAADRASPDLAHVPNSPLGRLRLANSSLSLIWSDGREDKVDNVNASLEWLRLRGSATGSGTGVWRGEPIELSADVGAPLLLVAGGSSPLSFSLKAAPLSVSFDGTANLASDFYAEGSVDLQAASVSRVLSWSAAPMTANGPLGALELSGTITAADGKLKLGDARLALDGNPATGVLELDVAVPSPRLSGSLAFEKIDLASIGQSLPFGRARGGTGTQTLKGIDLDLRLSAQTANAGPWPIVNAAGTIRVDADDMLLDLGNGELADGAMSASLKIGGAPTARQASLKILAKDVIPAQLASPESGYPAIDAPLTLSASLSGPFDGWQSFVLSAQGALDAEVGSGTVRNFSAPGLAAAVLAGETFALADAYSGMSSIQSGHVQADIRQGAALIRSGELLVDQLRLGFSGAVPYRSGGVALNGLISRPDDTSPAAFFVGGTWATPFVTLAGQPR